MAPENTLGGVDLPPPRPSGILRLCVYMCVWFRGQRHAPRLLEPKDQSYDSIRGSIRSPIHSKAVNSHRRCPPDTSLTCTWGTINSSVSWDDLGLWRPLEKSSGALAWTTLQRDDGRAGSRDPDTHWELLTLSNSAVSPLQSSWDRVDRVQVEGLGGYLLLRGKAIACYLIHCVMDLTPNTFLWSSESCSNCV